MGATIRSILELKDATIHGIGPAATVLEAVREMCRRHVGALLVAEGGAPIGIVSERDIMTRVLLDRREPSTTTVGDVMTKEIVCIGADRDSDEAMALMTARRVRHLPVVEEGIVIGMVSMGDLVRWESRHQDYEIRTLKDYVSGVYA